MWEKLFNATHIRTGFRCVIMTRGSGQCFCNFGSRQNPFTWVKTDELSFDASSEVPT